MSQHHARLNRWKLAAWSKAVIARADGRCQIPDPHQCDGIATQADHIVPVAQGGAPYDLRNGRGACRPGNNVRNRKHLAVDTNLRW